MLWHKCLTSDFRNDLAVNCKKKSLQKHDWPHHIKRQEVLNTNRKKALEYHMTTMTLQFIKFIAIHVRAMRYTGSIPIQKLYRKRNFKNSFFSSGVIVKNGWPFLTLSPLLFIHKGSCMPIHSKSRPTLIMSFDFPSMSRIVPTNVSHTFFLICMTSRLCLILISTSMEAQITYSCDPVQMRILLTPLPNEPNSKLFS